MKRLRVLKIFRQHHLEFKLLGLIWATFENFGIFFMPQSGHAGQKVPFVTLLYYLLATVSHFNFCYFQYLKG